MRLIAEVTNDPKVKRLMLVPEELGCFIFIFDSKEDQSCFTDEWYESLAEAKSACFRTYHVKADGWSQIEDAHEGCMQDRIAVIPVTKSKKR